MVDAVEIVVYISFQHPDLAAPQAVQLVVFAGEDVAREVAALTLYAGVGMIIEAVHQVRANDVY